MCELLPVLWQPIVCVCVYVYVGGSLAIEFIACLQYTRKICLYHRKSVGLNSPIYGRNEATGYRYRFMGIIRMYSLLWLLLWRYICVKCYFAIRF